MISIRREAIAAEAVVASRAVAPGQAHLGFDSVSRYYRSPGKPPFHALGPLSLQLRTGEFFSVVGPSGCGKSTLLELAAGLAAPQEGSIRFEGKTIEGVVPDGVAVVFQEDASFPWMNVYDNAAFAARHAGVAEAEVRDRVNHALSFMGLGQFARSYPAQLSGGMRQRVCLARAMVLRPRLMLLDEPFGALDQQTRLLMGDEVLNLWRDTGSTVMLITHSIDEAVMMSDRIGIMSTRPGRFIDIVETGWDADRDSTIASEARFGELQGRIWHQLRGESLKALEQRP